jgi:hypothetical protein
MSYSSKKTIVSMVSGLLLIAAYLIFALGSSSPAPDDLKSWAVAMLIFIGIGVALTIAVQILFHVAVAIGVAAKEREQGDKQVKRMVESTMVEDERDKLISLKSAHIGYFCAGFGFIAALMALAFGLSALAALHIVCGAFAFGSLVEGGINIYYYERGVQNG